MGTVEPIGGVDKVAFIRGAVEKYMGKGVDGELLSYIREVAQKKAGESEPSASDKKPSAKCYDAIHETKFFVLNYKHLQDLSAESRVKVEDAMLCVADELIEHNYYVCNQDEPYAQDVIDIIFKGENQKQAKSRKRRN